MCQIPFSSAFRAITLVIATPILMFAETVGPNSTPIQATARSWSSGNFKLNVDGVDREFLLDVPDNLAQGSALVFVFHGYTDSAASIRKYSGFSALANQRGFVAVYPQGTRDSKGNSFFNVGYAFHAENQTDDVKFAHIITQRLVKDLKLNPKTVYATGMSNGGDMSYYLASQKVPFVRAIAPVAGTMMKSWGDKFEPTSRIPVLHVHGTDDKTTLWQGDLKNRDGWGAYLSVDNVIKAWVAGLRLERSTMTTLAASEAQANVELHRWTTITDESEVRLYKIENGRHVWPKHLGNPSESTASVIWDFFNSHR